MDDYLLECAYISDITGYLGEKTHPAHFEDDGYKAMLFVSHPF